jgi:formylglycine-generating enzyme
MIAASLVLWTGADANPVLGLASSLLVSSHELDGDLVDDSRCAKRPRPKARILPKRRKRATGKASSAGKDESPGTASATRQDGRTTPEAEPIVPAVLERYDPSACPLGMGTIRGGYCIDLYEASLVQVTPDAQERPWPYYDVVPADAVVRAVSVPGVYPQGYISGIKARDACERSGKRLCTPEEWRTACIGPEGTIFPYGNVREVGRCNDNGRSSMRFFNPQLDSKPEHKWLWGFAGNMADPRLNQLDGTVTRTGERAGCTNGYGVFDMVGNLHEWVDDPNGTFQGGYYLDTHLNGDGCYYRTTAHPMSHLDYSTGFRCCADVDVNRRQ